jgi:uncharacterized protein with WD repeat
MIPAPAVPGKRQKCVAVPIRNITTEYVNLKPNSMYLVKVTFQPFDPDDESNKFQKGILDGLYVPKDVHNPPHQSKIKKQVWDYVKPRIKDKKYPRITANLIGITIKKLPEDFIVCEDKS